MYLLDIEKKPQRRIKCKARPKRLGYRRKQVELIVERGNKIRRYKEHVVFGRFSVDHLTGGRDHEPAAKTHNRRARAPYCLPRVMLETFPVFHSEGLIPLHGRPGPDVLGVDLFLPLQLGVMKSAGVAEGPRSVGSATPLGRVDSVAAVASAGRSSALEMHC